MPLKRPAACKRPAGVAFSETALLLDSLGETAFGEIVKNAKERHELDIREQDSELLKQLPRPTLADQAAEPLVFIASQHIFECNVQEIKWLMETTRSIV